MSLRHEEEEIPFSPGQEGSADGKGTRRVADSETFCRGVDTEMEPAGREIAGVHATVRGPWECSGLILRHAVWHGVSTGMMYEESR